MKTTILSLLFASAVSFAAFSQKDNHGDKGFEVISADHVTISKDSAVTTYTGNVDIKGNTFHFRKADKIVHNRKDNVLQVYNSAHIETANALSVVKGADGKKYILYQL